MRKRDDDFLAPDLTPLIDVVFILLIFFLVSSVFKKQELALLLNLPKSEHASTFHKETADQIIEITNNKMALNGRETTLELLESRLSTLKSKTTIHIRADEETKYVQVVQVLDLLKKINLPNVNLITNQE